MPATAPKFGRYVVLDELHGDDGERTLVAYDPELDRKVGLKVFPAASDGAQARRRERARVLAGIVHPHVVRVHDVGSWEGRLFAAMDFVEGDTVGPWIERERPPWRRVLEVFLAAGDGLAAAHAAGLIHGRFGGDALVIGSDGQIRVIDFVRSTPEIGSPPDEAQDRGSWCAALLRALAGWPPERDDASPPEPAGPRRIRRLIEQGRDEGPHALALPQLVERLRRMLGRRRQLGTAAVVLAVVATPTVAWLAGREPAPAATSWCEGSEARLAEVWNEGVAQRGRDAFVATRVPFADDAWASVEGQLERFVGEWRQAQADHCRPDPDDPTGQRHAAATVCLHRQLQALRAFVAELPQADAELVASASRTAASLGSPAACSDDPDDERYADVDLEQVLAVESALSRSDVQRELGRYQASLDEASTALEQAEALGARPLAAEARHAIGLAHARLGREEEAERLYHDAFSLAFASGNHEIVALSALDLVVLLAEQGRHDEARRWVEHAAAAIERDDSRELRTRLEAVRGLAAYRRGDHEEAKEHYEQSIALAEQADPPDEFAKMQASQALGNVMGRLGRGEEEIEILRRSLAQAEKLLGPQHPAVGHHLNSLATALARRGSVELGLREHARALAIFEGAFGPDHAHTIAARTSMASTLHEAGRDEEAAAAYEAALASAQRTFDEDDPRYVTVLGNVGMFHALSGHYVEAAALLSEAATRNEAIHGPDHEHTLGYLNNLAATFMFSGSYQEAQEVYRKIVERTGRAMGEDHPQLVPGLLGSARVERELEHPEVAAEQLERALRIAIERAVRPEMIGTVRFQLAQALWESGQDRERALTLARAAAQSFVVAQEEGWDIRDRLEEVRGWIAEHEGAAAP
ncbi:MAG: tetratricopeptide repeat protein [Myxococcales bacterium]|nr:tetratricopeptide repeat protein [Myxococcales bacterium]